MRTKGYHSKRRGVAGLVAAGIFFAMLFTIGTSSVLFENNANLQYNQQLLQRSGATRQGLQENLIITPVLSPSNHITFYVNNTGGVNANMTAFFVLDASGNVLTCAGNGFAGGGGTCSSWNPVIINVGKFTATFDTGYLYASGTTDTVKIITQRGGVFTQTYPLSSFPAANIAIITLGAGFAAINFATFRAYNVTGTYSSPYTGYQLSNWPGGVSAYSMSAKATSGLSYIFAVDLTNVDPGKKPLVIDSNCQLMNFIPPTTGGGTSSSVSWGIGGVSSSGVTQAFSTVTINSAQTVTLYFIFPYGAYPSAGSFPTVFIFLHGTSGGAPYGQNIPFVTTLYR